MRMCISCGGPIPADKRKDARYCGQSRCRGREYRKRHPKPTAVAQPEPQTCTTLACPCGRRYRITIAELHDHAAVSPPQPAQIAFTQTERQTEADDQSSHSLGAQALTQTAPQTDPVSTGPMEPASSPACRELRADTQTVSVMDTRPDERELLEGEPERAGHRDQGQRADAPGAAAPTQTDDGVTQGSVTPPQFSPPPLTTLELTFCDTNGRPICFRDAVARDGEDGWSLRAGARVVLRCDGAGSRSLGGVPGGWPRYFGGQSARPFGFDADLVVMFWDERDRRGKPASTKVLRALLGPKWKAELRWVRDERLRAGQGSA